MQKPSKPFYMRATEVTEQRERNIPDREPADFTNTLKPTPKNRASNSEVNSVFILLVLGLLTASAAVSRSCWCVLQQNIALPVRKPKFSAAVYQPMGCFRPSNVHQKFKMSRKHSFEFKTLFSCCFNHFVKVETCFPLYQKQQTTLQ